jgi:hypothetical protein
MNYLVEEENCLVCHNGNVAATDIEAEMAKPFGHRVQDFIGVHDPLEQHPGSISDHVECADCHNSHRITDAPATAPHVPGALVGVPGVSSSGAHLDEASFAYEICFKCHADHNVSSYSTVARQIPQLNTRLEFDLSNPSYHPVEGSGVNSNVPSLMSPYGAASIVYCTDCHASDNGARDSDSGSRAPHSSSSEFLLVGNYSTRDGTPESEFEYELCYTCHDRNSLLRNDSFSEHGRHIVEQSTPCSVCHDPHGISSTQGNSDNNSHLINFDVDVVSPGSNGLLAFEDMGLFAGRCHLTCHGVDHASKEYPLAPGVLLGTSSSER